MVKIMLTLMMAFGIIVIVNVNYVIQCANVNWIEYSSVGGAYD